MSVEKVERSEFPKILKELLLNPDYLFVTAGLKFHLDNILELELSFHLWRLKDGDRVVYCYVKRNEHKSLIHMESNCYEYGFCQKIADSFGETLFEFVNKADYVFAFAILQPLCGLLEEKFLEMGLKKSHPFLTMSDEDNVYYIKESSRKMLEEKLLEIPKGYKWSTLKPADAAEILSDQVYGKITSPKPYERTLSLLPSVAVYTEANELASYEFLDVSGMITSQYTRPIHRHQGIGSAVEWKLCQEAWKKTNLIPFKAVSKNRKRVIKLSDNSPLWTQRHDENGIPTTGKFFMYCKKEMPKIEFYEN
ncbi:unnamed protein product [Bursaphelenchus okinawaensis]|uniref:Glycine N-acyltransferase-like protein n=1 Tax=Bursaphelenchus okinawaensis TaxID=465554 RepID=A0A811KR25_9BILA|nr:unnamed protein product [Bursaphelenchus okinawaensis]CAG9109271.1 unnamed protein product [Bursaphelenchus okinawaensis]